MTENGVLQGRGHVGPGDTVMARHPGGDGARTWSPSWAAYGASTSPR